MIESIQNHKRKYFYKNQINMQRFEQKKQKVKYTISRLSYYQWIRQMNTSIEYLLNVSVTYFRFTIVLIASI